MFKTGCNYPTVMCMWMVLFDKFFRHGTTWWEDYELQVYIAHHHFSFLGLGRKHSLWTVLPQACLNKTSCTAAFSHWYNVTSTSEAWRMQPCRSSRKNTTIPGMESVGYGRSQDRIWIPKRAPILDFFSMDDLKCLVGEAYVGTVPQNVTDASFKFAVGNHDNSAARSVP